MITVIRSRFKASGMTYIIWISLASMLIGSVVPSLFKKETGEPWALKVNGSAISYRSYMQEMARNRDYIMRLRAQYGQFADYILQSMGAKDAQSLTYKQLVTQELMKQAMHKAGLAIDRQYVAYKLHDASFVTRYCVDILPPQFIDPITGIDNRALRSYLQNHGIPVEVFQHLVQEKAQQWFFNHVISTFCYVPDYMKTYEIKQKNGIKSFSYIKFEHDDFLKEAQAFAITEDEIARYFEQENASNRRYYVSEKRSGVCWEFEPKAYGIAIDSEVVEHYYEQHKTQKYVEKPAQLYVRQLVIHFEDATREETSKTIHDLHARIVESPDLFPSLVKEYSTDKKSAQNAGAIEPFSRGQKEQAFDRAAFILKEDGDISPVIELDNSYVIIQRIKREAQTYKPLKSVFASIESELAIKEFTRNFGQDVREAIASKDMTVIEQFVKKHKGVSSLLTNVSRDEGSQAQALFSVKSLDEEYTFAIEGEKAYIVRLDSIEAGHFPTLDSIRSVVLDDFYHSKASAILNQKITAIRDEIDQASFEDVAIAHKFKVFTINDLSTNNPTTFKDLREKGFDPSELLAMEKVGSLKIRENGYDRYLVCLNMVKQPAHIEGAESKKNDSKQFESRQENAFVGSFIASLYRDATIDRNDAITTFEEENSI